MDTPYTFRFYRTIMNDEGRPFQSTVEVINICCAKSPERAREAAVRRFARHQQLTSWNCLASGYELLGHRAPQLGPACYRGVRR